MIFFRPYEGKKPYLFVSYSHRDSEQVVSTIRILHDQKYRLWYDEGIPAGSDWPRNIAVHMRDCRATLFFLSRTALQSANCLSEIMTAKKQGKPILLLRLEEIDIEKEDERWRRCLSGAEEIEPAEAAETRAEHIQACPLLTEEFLGSEEDFVQAEGGGGRTSFAATVITVLAGLLLVIALSGVAALATGVIGISETPTPEPTAVPTPTPTVLVTPEPTPEPSPTPTLTLAPTPVPTPSPTPEPTFTPTPSPTPEATQTPVPVDTMADGLRNRKIEFSDSQEQEKRGIENALGTTDESGTEYSLLQHIEELYYVGQMTPKNLDGLEIDETGTVYKNSIRLKEGSVADTELIAMMCRLHKLALIDQPVSDISALSGLQQLTEVNLACSGVDSVEGLTNLPCLNELDLSHTGVKDLTPLRELPNLKTVKVSLDMLPIALDAQARYEVVLTR